MKKVLALLLAVVMARSSVAMVYKATLFMSFLVTILQYIARLAVECLADGVERREADGTGLARLQDGEVGGSDTHLFG